MPSRLNDLLGDVDDTRAATLALDFAEHAVELQADALDPKMRSAYAEYVAAAREAIALGRANDRLVRAYDVFFEVGWEFPGHSDVTGVADSAIRLGCQQMLMDVGAMNEAGRTNPTCQYIARRAQSDVGRWYAQLASADADRRQADRAARWEEARWQLLHVITTEPNPHAADAG
ncbi:hypothetical protein [Streptomyces sporangiiformans]|uniref:Uncharacterized protein n=1 Tax=Streptomyces sporangiiformans TaxID=2315329 RepID=A0A505DLR4_9ACTN|nr:hypothetical protein [Streptomyces sporangiiformans]TPQ19731.1 hypothetical protein FGD71_024065 [Streptomyces sporangiiformans]